MVEQDGHVLVVRWKEAELAFPSQWSLPGDALRASETAPEAVTRFAAAELGISVMGTDLIETGQLEGEGGQHQMWVYRVGFEGKLRYRSSGPFSEVAWATASNLPKPMAASMQALLGRLLQTKVR